MCSSDLGRWKWIPKDADPLQTGQQDLSEGQQHLTNDGLNRHERDQAPAAIIVSAPGINP